CKPSSKPAVPTSWTPPRSPWAKNLAATPRRFDTALNASILHYLALQKSHWAVPPLERVSIHRSASPSVSLRSWPRNQDCRSLKLAITSKPKQTVTGWSKPRDNYATLLTHCCRSITISARSEEHTSELQSR